MTTSNIPIGAIAYSRSGTGGIVIQVEADRVVVKCPDGLKRVPLSAIVKWEPSAPLSEIKQPENKLEIGHRLKKNRTPQRDYPRSWFKGGICPLRQSEAGKTAITGTIERYSQDGVWVRTDGGDIYHVSNWAIVAGEWEAIA